MPSEKEKKAADRVLERASFRELADAPRRFILAERLLSAAEKERDAHTNTRDVDDSFREGDIIEKLREWVREGLAMHGGAMEDRWDRGYACALRTLNGFLNDLQEQSTGGEG